MKNISSFKKMFSLAVMAIITSGCVIEPIQHESRDTIKGAPDWVNKGSMQSNKDGERIFIGVSSANRQGDMALQKSVADDNSVAEVAVVLSSYLDDVSTDYMNSGKSQENGTRDESVSRKLAEAASNQIKEGVSNQIDEALSRQFKEKASRQLKDDVTRQIHEEALRQIKEAVSNQTEFSLELEAVIVRQIKEAVSRQIKSTVRSSMTGVKIVKNWRDPNTGNIWSLSELDMKQVKTTMAAASNLNTDLKNHFEINADIIFDRAISEKNYTNPFLFK